MRHIVLSLLLLSIGLAGCSRTKTPDPTPTCAVPTPPDVAPKVHRAEVHGVELLDPYRWLRERENPDVLAYLEAENQYAAAMTSHTTALQEELYEEMLSHVKETDESTPYRDGDYWYSSRTEEGKSYDIHVRRKDEPGAPEELLVDENELAEGKSYFALGVLSVSPNGRYLAYSTDYLGNERYDLYVRDLQSGEIVSGPIPTTYYGLAWASDNSTLFYTRVDDANRPYRLYRHAVGTPPDADVLVYEEEDERFFLEVDRSRSDAVLWLGLSSAVTTEWHYLDAADPTGEFEVVKPRKQDVEYYPAHHPGADGTPGKFYVLTNEGAVNFRVYEAEVGAAPDTWREVVPTSADASITRVEAFADHLVLMERRRGLPAARVIALDSMQTHAIEFPEPTYGAWPRDNAEFDTPKFRMHYTSLTTPVTTVDYDMVTREFARVKEREVPNFDRTDYETTRLEATAPDGTKVPISLVWRRDTKQRPGPVLLAGYGSYGSSYDPYFSASRLALLDRGVTFAIAHVRGGGELGRTWYEDGKYLNKKNTFTDFIAVAEHLVAEGWTTPEKLAITGRSAGGLLMGAVTNMRPDLFEAVVAGVPFVDVTNTMLDPTIPLTVIEWEEWGNPQDREYFEYIRSYSPYDNVSPTAKYPNMLVTAGLNDPRVAYWEPAKWTAKLRDNDVSDSTILLKTNMGAGHGGASGRYDYLRELAFEHAFVLDHLGVVSLTRCR